MSKEELYKALKIFDREDLTYENDMFYDEFEEYMNDMKKEKSIEVFMSTEDMIKYSKLEQEIERLHSIIKEVREYIEENQEKQFSMNYEYGLTDKEISQLLKILEGESNE